MILWGCERLCGFRSIRLALTANPCFHRKRKQMLLCVMRKRLDIHGVFGSILLSEYEKNAVFIWQWLLRHCTPITVLFLFSTVGVNEVGSGLGLCSSWWVSYWFTVDTEVYNGIKDWGPIRELMIVLGSHGSSNK